MATILLEYVMITKASVDFPQSSNLFLLGGSVRLRVLSDVSINWYLRLAQETQHAPAFLIDLAHSSFEFGSDDLLQGIMEVTLPMSPPSVLNLAGHDDGMTRARRSLEDARRLLKLSSATPDAFERTNIGLWLSFLEFARCARDTGVATPQLIERHFVYVREATSLAQRIERLASVIMSSRRD